MGKQKPAFPPIPQKLFAAALNPNYMNEMDVKEQLDLLSLPTNSMKYLRQYKTIAICVGCKNAGTLQTMMICSKCKIAAYCSPQCQKRNWVLHKKECHQPRVPISFKLLFTFLSDAFLDQILPQTFVAAVGLDKQYTLNDLHIARCDLSLEPAFQTVRSLATGKGHVSDYPNGVEGVLQMRRMRALDPSVFIDSGREKIWKGARERAIQGEDSLAEFPWKGGNSREKICVGLIDFHMDGTEQIVTVPLPLKENALTMATKGHQCFLVGDPKFPRPSMSPSPLERLICFMIDNRIREDVKDQLRLRVRLPQEALSKYVGINLTRYMDDLPLHPPPMPGNVDSFLALISPTYRKTK